MNTITRPNGTAPGGEGYRLGGKGGRVSTAWQLMWDRLSVTDYTDAVALAEEFAKTYDLKPVSLISHMHRMAKAGHLESEVRLVDVEVTRGHANGISHFTAKRRHTFYRIKRS